MATLFLATCRVAASRRLRTGRVRLPAVSWLCSVLLLPWPLWCSAKAPGCSREPVPLPRHVLGPRGACRNASGRARASPPQLAQDVRAGNQARMLQPSAEPHGVSQALRSHSGLQSLPGSSAFLGRIQNPAKVVEKTHKDTAVAVREATIRRRGRAVLFRSRRGSVLLFRGKLLVFKGVFIKKKKEKKQAPSEAGDFSNRKEIWWFISVSSLLFGARQPLPCSDSGDSPSANNGARRGRGPFPAGKRLVPVKSPVRC